MTHLNLKELRDICKKYLQQVLGDEKGKIVRLNYPTADHETGQKSGQPFDARQDICYYTVLPADGASNRQLDTRYEDIDGNQAKQIHSYTRVIGLSLTFYGPNAYDNAFQVRMELLATSRDNLLARNGLHIIPDIAEPLLNWELYQNHWLERVDLQVQFYNRVTDEDRHTVGYIKSVPVIVVGGAEERTIEIKEGEEI